MHTLRQRGVTIALGVLACLTLAPLGIVVLASLHGGPTSTASGFTTSTWATLFKTLPLATGLKNSAILATGGTLVVLIVAPAAGFAFAKLMFPGSQAILYVVIGTIMVPVISVIIPEFVNVARVHMINSYVATILIYAGFNVGLSVFLFTVYFRNVPDALLEAALLDGASYLKIYWYVLLPTAIPAVITGGVLAFINIWNDFLIALLFMAGNGKETATVVLATVNGQHLVQTNVLLAGSLVSIVPTIVVYVIFQRYLVNGFSMTVGR